MAVKKILIADDHPVFRGGLRALFNSLDGFEVVGEASNGQEAVKLGISLQPDVILMDLKMPVLNGIEATSLILDTCPNVNIIVITMLDDDSVFAAIRAGARGYLMKDAGEKEIIKAIETVTEGGAIFSPGIARRLINIVPGKATGKTASDFPLLTEREQEILDLIVQGLENIKIAERLSVSLKTVQNHLSNIYSKLQVSDRSAAIARMRQKEGFSG